MLCDKLQSPFIEYGRLREFHLDWEWTNQHREEEQMAFENLVYIVENYFRNGWKNVIVTDLRDFRVEQIPTLFAEVNYLIATLVVESDDELARRLNARSEGFRDVEAALVWNRNVRHRRLLANEYRIDNTNRHPENAAAEILKLVEAKTRI